MSICKSKIYYHEGKHDLEISFSNNNMYSMDTKHIQHATLDIDPTARNKFAEYVISKIPKDISQEISIIDEQMRLLQKQRTLQLRKLTNETFKLEQHLETFKDLYPELFV